MRYNIPAGGLDLRNLEIGLKSASIFYSFPNITTAKGNDSFSYIWVDSTSHTVSLGTNTTYSLEDLNNRLHEVQALNNHYLYDSSGSIVYFNSIYPNSAYYACQLVASPVPTSLGSSYNLPSYDSASITNVALTSNVITFTVANSYSVGQRVLVRNLATNTDLNNIVYVVASTNSSVFTAAYTHANIGSAADTGNAYTNSTQTSAYPWALQSTEKTPQITVPATAFRTLVGFSAGNYPSSQANTQNTSDLSSSVPVLQDVSQVLIHCDVVAQNTSTWPSQLDSCGLTVGYGSIIQVNNTTDMSYFQTKNGTTNSLDVFFTDQNGIRLNILDGSGHTACLRCRYMKE
jgi:hypothetical protein